MKYYITILRYPYTEIQDVGLIMSEFVPELVMSRCEINIKNNKEWHKHYNSVGQHKYDVVYFCIVRDANNKIMGTYAGSLDYCNLDKVVGWYCGESFLKEPII